MAPSCRRHSDFTVSPPSQVMSRTLVSSGGHRLSASGCAQRRGDVGPLRGIVDEPGEPVVADLVGAELRQPGGRDDLPALGQGHVRQVPRRLATPGRLEDQQARGLAHVS